MPSPRSVLADITDLGLHPRRGHQVISANGRLRTHSVVETAGETDVTKSKVFEQSDLIVTSAEVTYDSDTVESKVVEVIEEPISDVVSEKKQRRSKKVTSSQ